MIRIIRKCPSGALSYEQDGKIEDSYSDTPDIQISRNGPYRVRGGVKLEGVDRAEGTSLEHCALCRCGASHNKPFCDGRNWYAGFGQYMGEFMTAVKYGMNITHILLNNSELGKISKEQRDGEWKVWQTDFHNVDFAEYGRLCGGVGVRVKKMEELQPALENALASDKPSLVEIISDPMLT